MKNQRYYYNDPKAKHISTLYLLPKIVALLVMVIAVLVMIARLNEAIDSFQKKQESAQLQKEK